MSQTTPIRVFHCDDSQAFTRLVEHWLDEHADVEWVGAERDPLQREMRNHGPCTNRASHDVETQMPSACAQQDLL